MSRARLRSSKTSVAPRRECRVVAVVWPFDGRRAGAHGGSGRAALVSHLSRTRRSAGTGDRFTLAEAVDCAMLAWVYGDHHHGFDLKLLIARGHGRALSSFWLAGPLRGPSQAR